MATDFEIMKSQISALQAAIMKELPESRVYSSAAFFEIWDGAMEVRRTVQGLFTETVAKSFNYPDVQDFARAQYKEYDKDWSFTPYSQALYEARNYGKVNIVLPDYSFRTKLYNFLEDTKQAVTGAKAVAYFAKFVASLNAMWQAITRGVQRIYNGVKMAVKTVVAAVEGAVDTFSFLTKNWMIILAGVGYLWYTRDK